MDTREQIAVMQAYLEGKTIQFKISDDCWMDIIDRQPAWNWGANEYRIKPESILPKTWEGFCKTHPIKSSEVFIDLNSEIENVGEDEVRFSKCDANLLPNKKIAEAMLALCKLIQLRDCYNDGWQPDWTDINSHKFAITIDKGCPMPIRTLTESYVMAFKTPDLQNAFLRNFKELIEIAKPLL